MDKVAKAHKEITGLLFDRLPDFATNDFETRWAECEALGWAIIKRQGEEHKADKYDALLVQDAAWHDIEDKHLADLATAQAQVAVMAAALAAVEFGTDDYGDCHWCGATVGLEGIGHYPDCQRQKALSAAPKVVWRKRVEIREATTGEWTGLYDEKGYVGKLNGTIGEGLDERWLDIFVLDQAKGKVE